MQLYWIWFSLLRITPLQKARLLAHFRDPEELYYAKPEALQRVEELSVSTFKALQSRDLSAAERMLECCRRKDIRLLTVLDEAYPRQLRALVDAPALLYWRGTLPDWDSMPAIGIVGTRKATDYGCDTARRFGAQIASSGALVVSGGAAGIDTAAMQGAMQAGRSVVAVLGCGVDVAYPARNRQFFAEVASRGCLLSEYPPGTEPMSWHFPQRNRIISGISNGILVVEAPERSGALSTARHALEQGRDVFAVPGNLNAENSAGTNTLLREGAKIAIDGWDVVSEYAYFYPGVSPSRMPPQRVAAAPQQAAAPAPAVTKPVPADKKSVDKHSDNTYSVAENILNDLPQQERCILALVTPEGLPVDDVIAQSGCTPGEAKATLTKLALKQLVVFQPGGRVSLK